LDEVEAKSANQQTDPSQQISPEAGLVKGKNHERANAVKL
jgi:hypothetical protein